MATCSVLLLEAIAGAVAGAGVDRSAFLAELGVAGVALEEPEGRVPLEVLSRAWLLAAERTGDDAFGLHFGARVSFGTFDVVDYAARSSTTAGDAARRLAKYLRILNDAERITLRQDAREGRVLHWIEAPWSPGLRHAAEAALAAYLSRVRALTGVHLVPHAVRFAHRAPARVDEHRRFFGVSVEFGAEHDELVFARTDADLPIVDAERALSRIVDCQADAMLTKLPDEGLKSAVARCVSEAMRRGEPKLADVAARLCTSPRSLQRRLATEGTTFQALLEDVRREAALGYLADARVELGEVAALLGFSEAAAFHRAFRRWTGETPQHYRRRRSSP